MPKFEEIMELESKKKHSSVFACSVSAGTKLPDNVRKLLNETQIAKLEGRRKFAIYVPSQVLAELGNPDAVSITLEPVEDK
jgi:hypothetical protein